MPDTRSLTSDALAPFAAMADALDRPCPRYLKKPGAVLLHYNGANITTTHLRAAREALKVLKDTK